MIPDLRSYRQLRVKRTNIIKVLSFMRYFTDVYLIYLSQIKIIIHYFPYHWCLGIVVTPTQITRDKPNRNSLPTYDSVIVIGDNVGLPSYDEAVGLSRDTISLHMWHETDNIYVIFCKADISLRLFAHSHIPWYLSGGVKFYNLRRTHFDND